MTSVRLRKFPFPYRAGLAVSNDADVMTEELFRLFHRFLNTTKPTPLGRGLGLPIGDSFFLFSSPSSPNRFTLFEGKSNRPSAHAALLIKCARSGLLDTLHSYGDFASPDDFSRELAQRGLDELDRHGIKIKVWVNHGASSNVQSIGLPQVPHYQGDVPGSKHYHADITLAYGIRYCWLGDELSDYVGHDSVSVLPWLSHQTKLALKALKHGRLPVVRRQSRKLLRRARLRDGNEVLSFQRYAGTGGATPVLADIVQQLSAGNLRQLKARRGYAILSQHFAVRRKAAGFGPEKYAATSPPYLRPEERAAFERLAEAYHNGDILVTTTSRLLQYNLIQRGLRWREERGGERLRVVLLGFEDPWGRLQRAGRRELAGLTFYTPRPKSTVLVLKDEGGETELQDLVVNPPDETGQSSLSVPYEALECPDL